jgi:hypothetical protein
MDQEYIASEKFGLPIGIKAPAIITKDVNLIDFSLTDVVQKHKGVFLNFFRGSW